ncbi:hypothetical protein [Pseudomonas phage PMBT14]|uniref:Putative DnaT-like domain-containing protein n=1 Tax=Pseudomonas phage PMBT14 TaxID=2059855 RepID=A0A2I6PI41_9CAUD|nr:head-tail adaptor Ad1 [Pseudomonas phage PMBT14]AUM59726.1 hypothetical protein [Pseudomonas phage PMBT14]UOL48371.1 hypothetical protein [Pseudomonas phage Almagne]
MALIIEDGTGVTGANSYASVAEIRAYCEARGIELPPEDAGVEVMAVNAFDYIESLEARFKGHRVFQRTSWPRDCVCVGREELPNNVIPWQVKEAQCQATAEATEQDLMPNITTAVKREKVDVLEVEYASATTTDGLTQSPAFPKVDAKLAMLMCGGGYRVRVVRG